MGHEQFVGGGVNGSGGLLPTMMAETPPFVGNSEFKLGVRNALGGTTARLAVSLTAPATVRVKPPRMFAVRLPPTVSLKPWSSILR